MMRKSKKKKLNKKIRKNPGRKYMKKNKKFEIRGNFIKN